MKVAEVKAKLRSVIYNAGSSFTWYKRWRLMNWAKLDIKEKMTDCPMLSKEQEKEVEAYFAPYFKPDMRFSAFYTNKTGRFCANYMPDDIYYSRVDTYYNDWDKALYMDDKCYYDSLFSTLGFKMPKTVCRRINWLWLNAENEPMSNDDAIQCIKQAGTAVLKKAVNSEGGHGVYFYDKNVADSRLKQMISELGAEIIVQHALKQSAVLSKLNASSVNTIRLLSLLDRNGNVKIYSCVLRMGIGGNKVDNASSGGITCGICSDGKLKPVAYNVMGRKYDQHPDTGVKFDTITIPGFAEICETVRKAHPQLANFRLLSWDVALDENDEPVLIEINMKIGELDFHQLNNGPLFGEDTKMILDEVFAEK